MVAIHHLSPLTLIACWCAFSVGCSHDSQPAVEEVVVEEMETADISPSDITAAMAELPEADRAAALAQKVCPVSDEPLGSMGTPIKIDVDGRDVFICCEGCREGLMRSPADYLKKLDAN